MSKIEYSTLPKVELHLHLDCSLSYDVVQNIDPTISLEEYNENFIAPPKCNDLADFLTRSVNGIRLMQTKKHLRMVTLDLFEQLQKDNVIYAEIRFAPLLHLEKGLTPHDVIRTVNEAVEEGIQAYNIEARIILCTLRNFTEAQSMETVRLVQKYKGSHVVGFDIAADEAGFPIDNHVMAFQYAKEHNIPCTAHAGEACGPHSVWETLEHFGPSRIGHGARSAEDEKLLDHLKEHDIHLELCPSSNVQTNVVDSISDHPVDKIYNHGVSMSISTDTRTITNVTLQKEYDQLSEIFDWSTEHFLKCNLEAIDHAFISEIKKKPLRHKILQGYQNSQKL